MTSNNYLCIDDQPEEVRAKLELLGGASDKLRFDCVPPTKAVEDTVKEIVRREDQGIGGLLIDLRLDRVAGTAGRVNYNAPTIAQHIRSLMAQRKLPAMPIVLWTLPAVKRSLYDTDRLSHDLFDEILDKDALEGSQRFAETAAALVDLAEGYRQLSQQQPLARKRLATLLVAPKAAMDPRADAAFESEQLSGRSISDAARFVLSSVVKREGLLVPAATLCARLGIRQDGFRGSPLEATISAFKYVGPFSGRQQLWWWKSVQSWWANTFKDYPAVLSLEAEQRVGLLRTKKLIDLAADQAVAQPIDNAYSTRFTCVCEVLREPLDPIDGFPLEDAKARPWWDRPFVSQKVAKAPAQHSFDKARLDPLVRSLSRN